ncbi:MAG: T9SS type A sorting domain-containing protein [Bacteroidales bacterium]|nr:T9SS type A sorting domain-containing protein [Bacteroidales bacterium]
MKKLVLFITLAVCANVFYGQYSTLDLTFGGDGKVTTMINDGYSQCSNIFPLADGKIMVAGIGYNGTDNDFLLIKYNEDGSVDDSFGSNGYVLTAVGDNNDEVMDVVEDEAGNYYLTGRVLIGGEYHAACVKYLPDGSLDQDFGTGGIRSFKFTEGLINQGNAIVLQNDGKILIAGTAGNAPDLDFALIRLNSDGTNDNIFGTDGVVLTDFDGLSDEAWAVRLTSDNRIVLAGQAYQNNIHTKIALVRYTSEGALDGSFGNGGKVTSSIGQDSSALSRDLKILEGDKIILSGWVDVGNNYNLMLARYNENGTPDESFGEGGMVIDDFGSWETTWRMLIQEDGKILCSGSIGIGMDSDFALFRYNPDGNPDDTFGDDGLVITDFLGLDYALGMAIDQNNKILAGGTTKETLTGTSILALSRYISGINVGEHEIWAETVRISVYPNPIRKNAKLVIRTEEKLCVGMEVYDLTGRIVRKLPNTIKLFPGENNISLNLSFLQKGMYLLRIKGIDKEFVSVKQFSKL